MRLPRNCAQLLFLNVIFRVLAIFEIQFFLNNSLNFYFTNSTKKPNDSSHRDESIYYLIDHIWQFFTHENIKNRIFNNRKLWFNIKKKFFSDPDRYYAEKYPWGTLYILHFYSDRIRWIWRNITSRKLQFFHFYTVKIS